jgi:hypothetical protein
VVCSTTLLLRYAVAICSFPDDHDDSMKRDNLTASLKGVAKSGGDTGSRL